MFDYYLRCSAPDYAAMLALGVMLGAITETEESGVQATQAGCWDYIGLLYEPTGTVTTTTQVIPAHTRTEPASYENVGTEEEPVLEIATWRTVDVPETTLTIETPDMAPLVDADGNEYIHINLRTPINLADAAAELAADSPEIAEGMDQLGKYFLLDVEGNARSPTQPKRVFA